MDKEKLLGQLEDVGLSKKEAKVYLASLELGPSTAQHIAAKSQISRPTAYTMIESLKDRGLISEFTKGKKKYFAAAEPQKVLWLFQNRISSLETQKNSFEMTVPFLEELRHGGTQPTVEVLEGWDGLMEIHRDMLSSVPVEGEIFNVADVDAARVSIKQKDLYNLWDELKKRKVNVKVLYYSEKEEEKSSKKTFWKRLRLVGVDSGFASELTIYADRLILLSLKDGEYFIVKITSKEISGVARILFEQAWVMNGR